MSATPPIRNVLIVEDEPEILELMRLSLEGLPVEVHTALDGQLALDWMSTQIPDLVVLDVMLPRIGGGEVYKAMLADERLQAVPVLVVSVIYPDESVIRSSALFRLPSLRKPFSPAVFAERVRELLGVPTG